jgi:hypothetical protein
MRVSSCIAPFVAATLILFSFAGLVSNAFSKPERTIPDEMSRKVVSVQSDQSSRGMAVLMRKDSKG